MSGPAAHGLGSTVATLKNDGPDNAKSLLGIPSDERAKTVVAVGHTDVEARRARPPRPDGGARKPITESHIGSAIERMKNVELKMKNGQGNY